MKVANFFFGDCVRNEPFSLFFITVILEKGLDESYVDWMDVVI